MSSAQTCCFSHWFLKGHLLYLHSLEVLCFPPPVPVLSPAPPPTPPSSPVPILPLVPGQLTFHLHMSWLSPKVSRDPPPSRSLPYLLHLKTGHQVLCKYFGEGWDMLPTNCRVWCQCSVTRGIPLKFCHPQAHSYLVMPILAPPTGATWVGQAGSCRPSLTPPCLQPPCGWPA